jgi:DNA ligase-1
MKLFAELYARLDDTTSINRKVDALAAYFHIAPPEDAVWAVSFLMGRRPKRLIPTRKLQQWAAKLADIPDWLFEACYDVVGDLAETITLVLPPADSPGDLPFHEWVEARLLPLANKTESDQRRDVLDAWQSLDTAQRFVWNKLITGGFRVGVSRKLVVRALSKYSRIDGPVLAHRLMGHWDPTPAYYGRLLSTDTADADISRPYPFYLAYPLDIDPEDLGDVSRWLAEWKWDGIRAQVIRRRGEVFVWTRGEELVTDKFPEVADAAAALPDGTVIDGELIGWRDGRPLAFGELQKRIGRKKVTAGIPAAIPVRLLAYDLLEHRGEDVRREPMHRRRASLEGVIERAARSELAVSERVDADAWATLAEARQSARGRGVEGLVLKRIDSRYKTGRKKGAWWKWKVDPYNADAVMIYAQRGHGRRSGLFSDYTLALWEHGALVPFAKAYSGLTDREIREVDRFVRRHTIERYGPVRAVEPELVFEIAFDGVRASKRHKSGIAVRFPRISRWRKDKSPQEADNLDMVRAFLNIQ